MTATTAAGITSRQAAVLYAAEVQGDYGYRPTRGDVVGSGKFASAREAGAWTAAWEGLRAEIRYAGKDRYDLTITRA